VTLLICAMLLILWSALIRGYRPPQIARASRAYGKCRVMSIIMHDLAGADPDLRFSPFCWRTRFALAHKGLPVETLPWRFTETSDIAFSGQGLVPVIRDAQRHAGITAGIKEK